MMSSVVEAEPGEAVVHLAAVLRLQTVGNGLLHLPAASQEPASVPCKLLPWATPILLLIAIEEKLIHVVTETNLNEKKNRQDQLLP